MDPLEVCGGLHLDPQEVIRSACHQIALADFRVTTHRMFETVEEILGLPVQCDLNDDRNDLAASGTASQGSIAPNDAFPFENVDTAQTGRGRQTDLCCELRIADAGVEAQHPDDMTIGSVQSRHEIIPIGDR